MRSYTSREFRQSIIAFSDRSFLPSGLFRSSTKYNTLFGILLPYIHNPPRERQSPPRERVGSEEDVLIRGAPSQQVLKRLRIH